MPSTEPVTVPGTLYVGENQLVYLVLSYTEKNVWVCVVGRGDERFYWDHHPKDIENGLSGCHNSATKTLFLVCNPPQT